MIKPTSKSKAKGKLSLPRLTRIRLRGFSLFAGNPNAEITVPEGVLCLVGANGIGKSTLLSAINYCLTGTVSDPTREFKSMEEYYRYTRNYSANYFRGRIAEVDKDNAEIAIDFTVGATTYKICRGLFEPEELRFLSIVEEAEPEAIDEGLSLTERHQAYADAVVGDIGVSSFEEFVFLQHFVFTFDEQRKTLLWNPRIMERVIYRAFGLDPAMAKKVDATRREHQQADSQVRNYQWESTRMRRRITEILSASGDHKAVLDQYNSLSSNYEELSKLFEEQTRVVSEKEAAFKDASLQLAGLTLQETALREDYSRFFNQQFDARPPVERHPLIVEAIAQHTCFLCGHQEDKAIATLSRRAKSKTCPVCDSLMTQNAGTQDLTKLKAADAAIAGIKKKVTAARQTLERTRDEEEIARKRWAGTRSELATFEEANGAVIQALKMRLGSTPTDATLSDFRTQLALLETEKQAAVDRRDAADAQLTRLRRTLEKQYIAVETSFVPMFTTLAHHFLGMPLSVQLDTAGSAEAKLVVSVRGTTRRQQQNLSESQRFFVDIALRMALTQHMSAPHSLGGIYIDTPEGSLDIAYEKRAGEMLAKFALEGHQIVMTANLNSSKLLLALARACGRDGMTVCRMTDWAELSEVQQEEEELFLDAYRAIEDAMAEKA